MRLRVLWLLVVLMVCVGHAPGWAQTTQQPPVFPSTMSPTMTGAWTFTQPVTLAAPGNAQLSMRDTTGSGLWTLRTVNVIWSGISDHTWAIHFNEDGSAVDQPKWGENIEPRYQDGAPPNGLFEKNWDYTSTDRAISYRPYRFLLDLNTHGATFEHFAATFRIIGRSQTIGTQESFLASTANRTVSMSGKLTIGAINPGGTYPLYVTGPSGGGAFLGVNSSNVVAGDILAYLAGGNAVTGQVFGLSGVASASTGFINTLTNSNSTSANAHASLQLVSTGASGGSPFIDYVISGVLGWRAGVDNASSDRFSIANNTDFGYDVFSVLTTGVIIMGHEAQSGITGTTVRGPNGNGSNVAGVTTTYQASLGTGTGAVGTLKFKAAASAVGSGSTVHSAVDHLTLGSGIVTANVALGMDKVTASASAPGAGTSKFEVVCGATTGTAKLIMYAGTSSTPVTIVDSVGSGVTGCP